MASATNIDDRDNCADLALSRRIVRRRNAMNEHSAGLRAASQGASVADHNSFVSRAIAAMNPHAPGAHPALHAKMAILLKHLHAFIDEAQVKEHELHAGIDFLTRACKNDDTMFLSDMTGVSMRVNDLTFAVP